MSLDQRARTAASSVRDRLDEITVPEPRAVVRRARRRRSIAASATTVAVAVVVVVTFVLVRRDDSARPVNVAVTPTSAPTAHAAATTDGLSTSVDKVGAGIGAGASLNVLVSDGSSLILAGERPGPDGYVVTGWWSADGTHWTESDHPTEHDSVSAIGTHAGTTIAVGAPGGPNAFVWRSDDGGRRWSETAHGPVFGASVANNRPGAFVTEVSWYAGWWVAAGGAADGYEGIWISRDGVQWQSVLDSQTSGSIDALSETTDGSLTAYAVAAKHPPDSLEIAWATHDPSDWGRPIAIDTPDTLFLQAVNADATVAIAGHIDHAPATTPVLRSSDGGRTWTPDDSFDAKFPFATASTVATVAGLDVVAGMTTDMAGRNRPSAWMSAGGRGWVEGPTKLDAPDTTRGNLGAVAALDNRIVFMEIAGGLAHYYLFDAAHPPDPSPPLATAQTVPGLAHATDLLRNVPVAYGPVQYAEIVSTTRDKLVGIFGTTPQSPAGSVEVLRVVGTFVCNECSRPVNAKAPRGNEILIVIPRDSDRFPAGGGSSFSIGERSTDLSSFGTVYRMPN